MLCSGSATQGLDRPGESLLEYMLREHVRVDGRIIVNILA
jgi:hypothetical protein